MTDAPRFVNETKHECGCVTRFDTIAWHSVAVVRCDFHAAAEGRS